MRGKPEHQREFLHAIIDCPPPAHTVRRLARICTVPVRLSRRPACPARYEDWPAGRLDYLLGCHVYALLLQRWRVAVQTSLLNSSTFLAETQETWVPRSVGRGVTSSAAPRPPCLECCGIQSPTEVYFHFLFSSIENPNFGRPTVVPT